MRNLAHGQFKMIYTLVWVAMLAAPAAFGDDSELEEEPSPTPSAYPTPAPRGGGPGAASPTATAAAAAPTPTPSPSPSPEPEESISAQMKKHQISDEEIQVRCAHAIAQRIDMVNTEDGRRITRCEYAYETARKLAIQYEKKELELAATVTRKEAENPDCNLERQSNTQSLCIRAGQDHNEVSAQAFEELRNTAESAINKISSLNPK